MLAIVYFNKGNKKAFKKAISLLSSKLGDNGYSCSLRFDDLKVYSGTLILDNFNNAGMLGGLLSLINSMLSLIALDISKFDDENIYPDYVKFRKNV